MVWVYIVSLISFSILFDQLSFEKLAIVHTQRACSKARALLQAFISSQEQVGVWIYFGFTLGVGQGGVFSSRTVLLNGGTERTHISRSTQEPQPRHKEEETKEYEDRHTFQGKFAFIYFLLFNIQPYNF